VCFDEFVVGMEGAEKLGESAVTERARSPSACCAAQAKYTESAPPESATISEPASARRARSESSFCSGETTEISAARIGTNAVIANKYNALLDESRVCKA
jgi:hypothetical protein